MRDKSLFIPGGGGGGKRGVLGGEPKGGGGGGGGGGRGKRRLLEGVTKGNGEGISRRQQSITGEKYK